MAEKLNKKIRKQENKEPYVISICAFAQFDPNNLQKGKKLIENMPLSLDAILEDKQLDFTFRQALEHVCNSAPLDEQAKADQIRKYLMIDTGKVNGSVRHQAVRLDVNGRLVALDDPIRNFFELDDVSIVPGRSVQVQRLYIRISKHYLCL